MLCGFCLVSRQDTETTQHHSVTQNTEAQPNSANISGRLKTVTLTTLFHGAFLHPAHLTKAQVKDATSVLEKIF